MRTSEELYGKLPSYVKHLQRIVVKAKLKVSFIQFLKDNNIYDNYMHNVKIENQRWYCVENYIDTEDIKMLDKTDWIYKAFYWCNQKEKESKNFWENTHIKWLEICKDNKVVWE